MAEPVHFAQLFEYRALLLERLERQPAEFAALARTLPPAEWHTRRVADGATCHQIIVHVRDAEGLAYWPRIRRILAEAEPHLDPFPHHRWSLENYEQAAAAADVLADFARARQAGLAVLRTLTPAEWTRVGFHPPSGPRTLQWWVERLYTHARNHLTELRAVITQPARLDPYAQDLG